jgi:radical SAM protein with 4Fe4S-binding SPASM domain
MNWKYVRTPGYNYDFNTNTGYFERWGVNKEDDPQFSPIGPEILDIEVSTVCHAGNNSGLCKACYKSNTSNGKNMSLDTFKVILDKMPTITQIAIGIGDIDGNPGLFDMMEYSRSKGVVPNITINGFRMTDDYFDLLAKYCGAVAISDYNIDVCAHSVKELTDRGMTQVNIHQILAEETKYQVHKLLDAVKNDSRFCKLNAVVFMTLKQKGRGENFHKLSDKDYKNIILRCFEENISFGSDSCGASRLANMMMAENVPDVTEYMKYIENCEASLFSSYLNVDGKYYPCSFAETEESNGIDVVASNNFLEDVWFNSDIIAWRRKLLSNCRNCPIYHV